MTNRSPRIHQCEKRTVQESPLVLFGYSPVETDRNRLGSHNNSTMLVVSAAVDHLQTRLKTRHPQAMFFPISNPQKLPMDLTAKDWTGKMISLMKCPRTAPSQLLRQHNVSIRSYRKYKASCPRSDPEVCTTPRLCTNPRSSRSYAKHHTESRRYP